jgi:hypothetical protein
MSTPDTLPRLPPMPPRFPRMCPEPPPSLCQKGLRSPPASSRGFFPVLNFSEFVRSKSSRQHGRAAGTIARDAVGRQAPAEPARQARLPRGGRSGRRAKCSPTPCACCATFRLPAPYASAPAPCAGADHAAAARGGQGKCPEDEPLALLRPLWRRKEDAHHGSPPRGTRPPRGRGGRRRHASRNRADASPSAQPQPVGLLALLHERVWKGSLEHAHRAPGTDTVRALRKIYGPGVEKLKVDVRAFKFKSSEVEVTFLSSNYHIELNPSDVGPYRHKSSKVLS